jgi:hypothetical protein
MYDLLKPDGINVVELGNGKYQLMRPAALSNLHNIAFRSFTGDLLPFTTIELPNLHAELIMMTNGLKSATLAGQDTMDIPAVNTYENTKQNIILSIDKAWTYNKDAESQVIYNIEEIVGLMNEKLKDYFIFTAIKSIWNNSNTLSTIFINNFKQYMSELPEESFSSIMYSDITHKLYIPTINTSNVLQMNEVSNSSTILASGYVVHTTFFDPYSNIGFIVYRRTNNNINHIFVDSIKYDSGMSIYVQQQVGSFNAPRNVDTRVINQSIPSQPLHFFAYGSSRASRIIGYTYIAPNPNAPTHPCLYFTFYTNNTKYTKFVDIYDFLTSNPSIAQILSTHNVLYVYGLDIKEYGDFHLIASQPTGSLSDSVYGIIITFPAFSISSTGNISFGTDVNTEVFWSCTLEQYVNQKVYKSLKYSFTDITKFTVDYNENTIILPNNCYIHKDPFKYVYYGNTIFSYNTSNNLFCKCYDTSKSNCYIGSVAALTVSQIGTLYTGASDFVLTSNLPAASESTLVNFGNKHCLALINNDNNNYFPAYAYNQTEATNETYFNEAHTPNAAYLITVNETNVACSAVDTSNDSVALNPPNGGYLCSNLSEFIKLDELVVTDNAITGSITIPQIEFASNYVLNFNLKVYSDPYYFSIYTLRDFTQQGHAYNLDVNHTELYYRASNSNVLNILEYLILLKYNYNLVKLRVYGFPNNDGIVFNLNENSYVSFKNMPTDNTMNNLIVELIGDDGEALSSEILQQLFGKVSLAIDWMQ